MFCIISPYYSFYDNKFQRSTYYSLFLSILYNRRLGLNLPDSLPFFVFCIISPYYSFYYNKFQRSTYYSLFLSILYMIWSNATAQRTPQRHSWTWLNATAELSETWLNEVQSSLPSRVTEVALSCGRLFLNFTKFIWFSTLNFSNF